MMNCYSHLLIIADDFTGANDTGVQMTKKGAHVNVYFEWSNNLSNDSSDIIVINTDSRATSTEQAKKRIKEVVDNNLDNRIIYKKVDSTLRGNIGAEIEALLTCTDYDAAIVVPSFPDMKRTVKNSTLYVNNVALIDTEFATDPKTPIYSSQIKENITKQSILTSEELTLSQIRNQQLNNGISQKIKNGVKVFILDAETNEDLKTIAEQLSQIKHKLLLVGSAGLISYLPATFTKKQPSKLDAQNHPLVVVAGSMSKTTQNQIEYALSHGKDWQVIDIDINDFLPKISQKAIDFYSDKINKTLSNQNHLIIRTCKNDADRFEIDRLCQQSQMSRQQLGEHISLSLGKLVKQIPTPNLFLTGGDIAIAIAKALGATGFYIEGEVTAGVPYGKLIGKEQLNYRIFTKAGGFGEADILIKSLEFI